MTLLTCPFCGSQPELKYIGNDRSKKRAITIKCPKCRIERTDGALRFGFDWLERIVEKNWNTRSNGVANNDFETDGCPVCGRAECTSDHK